MGERVCGVYSVDVSLLRRKTSYEGWSEDDATIRFFWDSLGRFSQDDLRHFLHFVWGRSRLPQEGSVLWGGGMKIHRLWESNCLPHAHTCFFQIDLPEYETQELLIERVLFAARNCVSLDIA